MADPGAAAPDRHCLQRMQAEGTSVDIVPPAQTIKMAVIVIATVPMLAAYPFVQKHFTKGALLGAVKG